MPAGLLLQEAPLELWTGHGSRARKCAFCLALPLAHCVDKPLHLSGPEKVTAALWPQVISAWRGGMMVTVLVTLHLSTRRERQVLSVGTRVVHALKSLTRKTPHSFAIVSDFTRGSRFKCEQAPGRDRGPHGHPDLRGSWPLKHLMGRVT